MKTNIKDILASKTKQALASNILQADNIKKNIVMLDELRSLIPPLSEEELKQLEENILAHGCQTPLQLWQTTKQSLGGSSDKTDDAVYVLVDGHNRLSICKKYNLPFEVYQLSFASIKEVKDYMINLQLGRRNLSPTQISYFRGLRYNNEKVDKLDNLSKGQNVPSGKTDPAVQEFSPKGQNVPSGISTAERLAHEYNVNAKTIKRDAEFAKGLEKLTVDLRNNVLNGTVKVDKALIQEVGKDASISKLVDDLTPFQKKIMAPDNATTLIQQKVIEITLIAKKISKSYQKTDLELLIQTANEALKLL